MTLISIVIVNWNTRQLLAQAIDSLYATADEYELDIIVVDNGSTDGSQNMIATSYPHVRLLENQDNAGFARANNQGVEMARGDCVLLFNSDAWGTAGFLTQLVQTLESNDRIAMVGAQLRSPDGSFQASHTPFPTLWQEFLTFTGLGRRWYQRNYPTRGPEDALGSQQIDFVEGACMLVRRSAYLEVGGFDESYWMYSEDVDLCFRLKRAGWQVWYDPAAKVFHMSAGSSRHQLTQQAAQMYQSRVRFFRRHYGWLSATALKIMILKLTAVKIVGYGILRFFMQRKIGRDQVSLLALYRKLSQA